MSSVAQPSCLEIPSGCGCFPGVNFGAALQALVVEGNAGLLPSIMEVYARPTRIVRGKEVSADWAPDEALFELEEEHALWAAYQATCKGVHPAMGIQSFLQVNALAAHRGMGLAHHHALARQLWVMTLGIFYGSFPSAYYFSDMPSDITLDPSDGPAMYHRRLRKSWWSPQEPTLTRFL